MHVPHAMLAPATAHTYTQGVRQKHFQNIRQKIGDSLFLVKPTFAPHLREIWTAANEIRSISFASSNPNHLYQLQEWADLQVCWCGVLWGALPVCYVKPILSMPLLQYWCACFWATSVAEKGEKKNIRGTREAVMGCRDPSMRCKRRP